MKKLALILTIATFGCYVSKAQMPDISGNWTMFEMSWTQNQNVNKTTEDQIKAQGAFVDYYLLKDGKFKLISNMTGSGKLDTITGTWKLNPGKLTFSMAPGGNQMEVVWDFSLTNGVMDLKRTSPDGSTVLVNTFRRK